MARFLPDYIPPITRPSRPGFFLWAWDVIVSLDLHPDTTHPPGLSESEHILKQLWNLDHPSNPVDICIFRPRINPTWPGVCNHCGKACVFEVDRPFHCPECVRVLFLETHERLRLYGITRETRKAQEHADKKKGAAARKKERKRLEKLHAPEKLRAETAKKHPLLLDAGDDWYNIDLEDDPYVINKAKAQHNQALEMDDDGEVRRAKVVANRPAKIKEYKPRTAAKKLKLRYKPPK